MRRPAGLLDFTKIAADRNSRRSLLAFDGRACACPRDQDGEDHMGLRYRARVSHSEWNPGQGWIHGVHWRDHSGWNSVRELRLFRHAWKCAAGFRCKVMLDSLKLLLL